MAGEFVPSNADRLVRRQKTAARGSQRARRRDLIDMIGQRFGRLTVIELAPVHLTGRLNAQWLCRCDCGNTARADRKSLLSGDKRSCGCLRSETSRAKALRLLELGIGAAALQRWRAARRQAEGD